MRRTLIVACAIVAVAGWSLAPAALAGQKETEHVSKVVPIARDGVLKLKTFSGRVTIVAADRADVSIQAVRRATRDRLDHISLEIRSEGGNVYIDANKRDDDWSEKNDNVVETEFDIEVPRSVGLDIHSFSSGVAVTGVKGKLDTETFSGTLKLVDCGGAVDAKTFSGDIRIGAAGAGNAPAIEAETFSGDIEVTVAASASADVEFETFSGDINSEAELTLKSKSKRSLRASLNAPGGAPNALRFKTFSGDVRLLK
jgi:DUF4097 and DUF4098 domain-containing protein YvlB